MAPFVSLPKSRSSLGRVRRLITPRETDAVVAMVIVDGEGEEEYWDHLDRCHTSEALNILKRPISNPSCIYELAN